VIGIGGYLLMGFNEKLFEENFTFAFKATVSNNFLIATKAFEDFWRKNNKFLMSADDLYGRILYYAVNQQFKKAATKTADVYLVKDSQVSKYKNKAVFLSTNDYVTSICRTEKPKKLPSKAKYKLELAQGNQNNNNQLLLDLDLPEISVTNMKKYAIIGYRYINGEMRHLNIIVPDSEFQELLFDKDLLGNVKEYEQYVPEELIYDQVSDLKNDIVATLKEAKIL